MGRKTFRKVITSPDKLDRINQKNKGLRNQFLKHKGLTCSEKTIQGYESDLNIFFVYCLEELDNKFFIDMKKLELSNFFSFCVDELGWGSSRYNRMRSALSSLSQFVEAFYDDDYPQFRNLILRIIPNAPKSAVHEKTVLSDSQIENLIQYLSETDSQKACWFALAISSGARFSELLRFDIDLIDESNRAYSDIFIETLKPIKTKGRGKGKFINKFIIADIFLPHYEKWMKERSVILEKAQKNHNSMFIRKNGEPATSGTVRSWIASINKKFDIDLYPHALRHYLTTYLSKKGLPPQLIRDLFGWESVELVELYDDTESKDREWKELENLK